MYPLPATKFKGPVHTHRSSFSVHFYPAHQSFSIGVLRSGCQGFHQNKPKMPGTKLATTILCSSINTTASQHPSIGTIGIARGAYGAMTPKSLA